MARRNKNYGGYRGAKRQRRGRALSIIVVVLAILFLLFAVYKFTGGANGKAGSFILFRPFKYIDSLRGEKGGSDVDAEPILIREDPRADPLGLNGQDEDADESGGADAEVSKGNVASPERDAQAVKTVRCVRLSRDKIGDPAYIERIAALGDAGYINSALVDLKLPNGALTFPSQTPLAQNVGAVGSADIASAVKALKDKGLYVVGFVSAFRDNLVPAYDKTLAIRTGSGARWLDYDSISWLNPYAEGSVDYISDLSAEAAAMGFDELVYYNFSFPVSGKRDLIVYGDTSETSRASAVTLAFQRLADELKAKGARVSVMLTDGAALSGADVENGQSTALCAVASRTLFEPSAQITFDTLSPDLLRPCAYINLAGMSETAVKEAIASAADASYILHSGSGEYPEEYFAN